MVKARPSGTQGAPARERAAILLILVLLASLTPSVAATTEWPQFHQGAGKRGVSADAVPASLGVLWTAKAKDFVEASPVVANGKVFVASRDKSVVAYNATTGALAWNRTLPAAVVATPAVSPDYVFVPALDGKLHVLDQRDGRKLSEADLGSASESSPALRDGMLYVGTEAGKVFAFDTAGGKLTKLWEFSTELKDAKGAKVADAGAVRASPTVHGSQVIFGSLNGHLYVVDSNGDPDKTTDLLWVERIGAPVFASAVVQPAATTAGTDTFIVPSGGHDGTVWGFSAKPYSNTTACPNLPGRAEHPKGNPCSELVRWKYASGSSVRSTPAIDGNLLVFGGSDGRVYALDLARLPNCSDATPANACAAWKRATGAEVWSSPALTSKAVVVGSHDRSLYVLDRGTGALLQEPLPLPGSVASAPALAGGRVYVTSLDGTLTALGATAVPLASARDLRVSNLLLIPPRPEPGELVEVLVTIANGGTVAAGPVEVRVAKDGAAFLEASLDLVPPGGTQTLTKTLTWDNDTQTLEAVVDPRDEIEESDEGNNAFTLRLGEPAAETGNGDPASAAARKAEKGFLPAGSLLGTLAALLGGALRGGGGGRLGRAQTKTHGASRGTA